MSRYVGDNFNRVLFLLREPDSSGKKVSEADNVWISRVLNFEEAKNADKYRRAFFGCLNSVGLSKESLPHCAFDNIKPNGGNSSTSPEYKNLTLEHKAARAFSIIDEIKPAYIFTCSDIYNAVKRRLADDHLPYAETNDGIAYSRGRKNRATFTYSGRQMQIFQIYHPGLGWNILTQ